MDSLAALRSDGTPIPKEPNMSTTEVSSETAIETTGPRTVDMKLEVVAIPVSDVDRAKRFYADLGWRLDADFVKGDEFRGVQFTPPGSPASIHFGKGVTSAAPGTAQGLFLVVSDIEAARAELIDRGVEAIRSGAPMPRSRRSAIRTATRGCCRRSPRDCPVEWTRTKRYSLPQPSWQGRCDARRPHTASTRNAPASTTR
jgi:catechol 2,3-dioxygenase-like lactoylglutathione lyase family enzyme